jgi:hypothetical protein
MEVRRYFRHAEQLFPWPETLDARSIEQALADGFREAPEEWKICGYALQPAGATGDRNIRDIIHARLPCVEICSPLQGRHFSAHFVRSRSRGPEGSLERFVRG